MNFDDMSLHRLFGHEAAEDEDPARLKKYYFKCDFSERCLHFWIFCLQTKTSIFRVVT